MICTPKLYKNLLFSFFTVPPNCTPNCTPNIYFNRKLRNQYYDFESFIIYSYFLRHFVLILAYIYYMHYFCLMNHANR